jgi:metal-sulfur cluster biosynthetic enzyme
MKIKLTNKNIKMSEIKKESIIEKIGNIADPDLGYTLSSLNAIKKIRSQSEFNKD